jgi:hypothetical protein
MRSPERLGSIPLEGYARSVRKDDPAAVWLLESQDPSIRYLTLTEVLGRSPRSRQVGEARDRIPDGPRVRALLRGQKTDGGFGVGPYSKWRGAHWRLVSLVELSLPKRHPKALAAIEQVLGWLTSPAHLRSIRKVNGLVRQHASQEGNAVAVCCRLGLAGDSRVEGLVHSLLDAQWPDGGWNCDPNPSASHSSFYESITPLWGLIEYARATGDSTVIVAAERAAELFLQRRMFRSKSTGEVINDNWMKLHYPLYWHYDILHGLVVLSRFGKTGDSRAQEALEIIDAKRRDDGCWAVEGSYWRGVGEDGSTQEVVDWGRRGRNEFVTLNALRVLRAAEKL